MRSSALVILAAVLLAGCGTSSPVEPADPAGYPVECQGDVCYQLGHRVAFLRAGSITAAAACARFGRVQSPPRSDYLWQPISDPAPGAPPSADTYVCAAPGVNLVNGS